MEAGRAAPSLSATREEARFAFGRNWTRFLSVVDEERITAAEQSLRSMLRVDSLAGRTFLDAGCGSGLFSLAARRLGARVHSFDDDPDSVAATLALRARWRPEDDGWRVERGSVLDASYLESLGRFDVVYSWGVLHHTGNMRRAMELIAERVARPGLLFVALYNDQGALSRYWTAVKRLYHRGPVVRGGVIVMHAPYLLGVRFLVRLFTGRLRQERGMTLRHDMLDWLGGYPFEVARPDDVIRFYAARGFQTREVRTCGRRAGCNEFVFSAPTTR